MGKGLPLQEAPDLDILTTKEKKLLRDKITFQENKAYTLNNMYSRTRLNYRTRQNNNEQGLSDASSVSSLSISSRGST